MIDEEIKKIIDSLSLGYYIGYSLVYYKEKSILEDQIKETLAANGFDCEVKLGTTKIIIIPKNSNVIIKTPLFGSYHYPELYNEQTKEIEIDYNNVSFHQYYGANYKDKTIDPSNYCEAEIYFYEKAISFGLQDFFIPNIFLKCDKNGRPYYISTKCDEFVDDRIDDRSELEDLKPIFIEQYGQKKTDELFSFIKRYKIEDIHNENVMVNRKTGKIVIIDYAGFKG